MVSSFSAHKDKNGAKRTLVDFLLCPLLFALFAFFAAAVRFAGDDPTAYLGVFSALALLLSGGCSSAILTLRHRGNERAFSHVMLPAAAFVLVIFAIALIVSKGKLSLSVPLNLSAYLLLFALVHLFCKRKPKKKRRYS